MTPDSRAVWPDAADCMPVVRVASPHPAVWPIDRLIAQLDLRTQTRGGPGGQHRNRTESGVFATFQIDDIHGKRITVVGEATEQRRQPRNRAASIQRLRLNLAVAMRTTSRLTPDTTIHEDELAIVERARRTSLKLSDQNELKASVLAIVLNDLHVAGGQPSLLSAPWGVSTSRLNAFVRSVPAAWTWLNQVRAHHGRKPLR